MVRLTYTPVKLLSLLLYKEIRQFVDVTLINIQDVVKYLDSLGRISKPGSDLKFDWRDI